MKRKYNEWVTDYPDRVVIKKEGFFYTCRENSAYIVATILNYQIGMTKSDGTAITGSPSLDKITEELKRHHISFVAIENDVVIDEEEFADNQFWKFVDEDSLQIMQTKLVTKDHEKKIFHNYELRGILDALIAGVDPFTGEIFDDDSLLKTDALLTIFELAKKELERKISNELSKDDLNPQELEVFERLRKLRANIAAEQGKPAYTIFKDKALVGMAKVLPKNEQEMLSISGIGKSLFDKYGESFLELLNSMKAEENADLKK